MGDFVGMVPGYQCPVRLLLLVQTSRQEVAGGLRVPAVERLL
jgi:hypothetical protein